MVNVFRTAVAATVGNIVEWFDFALYGNFIVLFGTLFFPADAGYANVAGFLVFSIGFICRPLGGILFGHIGDTIGRKTALTISVLLMSSLTFVIALLPTYQQVGILAPIILFTARIIQGLSLGGEYGGAVTLMAELAPKNRKTLYSSIALSTASIGVLLGTTTVYILSICITEEQMNSFGWRIPFVIGGLMGLFGLYMRTHMSESPEFDEENTANKEKNQFREIPFMSLISSNKTGIILGLGITLFNQSIYTINSTYIPFYVQTALGGSLSLGSYLLMISTISTVIACIGIGYIADRFGPMRVSITAAILVICFAFPVFWLLETKILYYQVIAQMVLGTSFGMAKGVLGISLYKCFPTRVRFSGLSFCNNVAAMTITGMAPIILFSQCDDTLGCSSTSASLFIVIFSAISILAMLKVDKHETNLIKESKKSKMNATTKKA